MASNHGSTGTSIQGREQACECTEIATLSWVLLVWGLSPVWHTAVGCVAAGLVRDSRQLVDE